MHSASSTAAEPSAYATATATERPGRRAHRDHGREDRAGARRVDEPERGAHDEARREAVAARARAEARQPGERRLEPGRDAGEQQREAEPGEHDDGERPQRIGPEADAADDLGDADDRHRERHGQPEHDPERTAPAAGAAGRQQGRQDRQHARAERGARAGEQREGEQDEHPT